MRRRREKKMRRRLAEWKHRRAREGAEKRRENTKCVKRKLEKKATGESSKNVEKAKTVL